VEAEERKKSRDKLKVFLDYSAGVGKIEASIPTSLFAWVQTRRRPLDKLKVGGMRST
jgi:hypothetical protein